MNKKLIIGIVAAVAALAIIIAAIIGITKGFGSKDKPDTDSGNNSEITSITDSSENALTGNEDVVSDYKVNDEGNAVVETKKPDSNTIIEVPIMVSNNKNGFYAGQFAFTYDANALTYIDYGKGNLFDEYEVVTATGKVSCIINAKELKDVKGDGKLIVLKFKAKDGAKAGNYKITVESSSMGSVEEKLVNPTVSGGVITIK